MQESQSSNQLNKVKEFIHLFKAQILLLICICSFLYTVLSLIDFDVLVAMLICLGSFVGFLIVKWTKFKEKKLINSVSPKARELLTEKSILDIYRDVVYFPKVSKIIGAFVKGAIAKPPPDKIHQSFDQLPQSVIKTINTKGILHLAPEKVQKLFLQGSQGDGEIPQNDFKLPDKYGQVDYQWYNRDKYDKEEMRIHEHTMGKDISRALHEKVQWKHLIGLCAIVVFALMQTKKKKMGRILLYNGSFVGIVLAVVLLLVKTSKPLKKYKLK